MLFDLRGRGRRRSVRVIYAGLALLMGSGLVLFGVGSFGGSGILSNISGSEGSNSASFSAQIKKYRKQTEKQPSNTVAWEDLTKAILHESGGEAYVTSAGAVTSKGKELFSEASQTWNSYVALNPPKPNTELAELMLKVYGEEGLNEPSKAVQVLQIVVAARPNSASLYSSLAEYAYKAKNVRVGDLASEKAVSLAPAAQRARLKQELAEVKANPSGEKEETVTTNGKTYAGKLNSKKEIIGATEVKKATPQPITTGKSTTPTTKKK
jgi:hypothetical protein